MYRLLPRWLPRWHPRVGGGEVKCAEVCDRGSFCVQCGPLAGQCIDPKERNPASKRYPSYYTDCKLVNSLGYNGNVGPDYKIGQVDQVWAHAVPGTYKKAKILQAPPPMQPQVYPDVPQPGQPPSVQQPPKNEKKGPKEVTEFDEGLASSLEGTIVASPKVAWKDVIGQEEVLEQIETIVREPLDNPRALVKWSGILLYGPPGTGKSLTAKAIATSAHPAKFMSITSADILGHYIGESQKRVKAVFSVAQKNKPVVLFIDEIDSILGRRSGKADLRSFRRRRYQAGRSFTKRSRPALVSANDANGRMTCDPKPSPETARDKDR